MNVLSCFGSLQYRFYGEQVVRACVENSCHYIDISGEPQVTVETFFELDIHMQLCTDIAGGYMSQMRHTCIWSRIIYWHINLRSCFCSIIGPCTCMYMAISHPWGKCVHTVIWNEDDIRTTLSHLWCWLMQLEQRNSLQINEGAALFSLYKSPYTVCDTFST